MRRRDLLAGLSFVPLAAPAFAQCAVPTFRRINLPGRCEPDVAAPSLDLGFMTPGTLDPRISFTRASTATYFDSAGVMRNAAVNSIRNSMMVGAVPGTPGTLPTNWNVSLASGLSTAVIGTGTEDGVTYIDVRISGTSSGVQFGFVYEAPTTVAATTGQVWSMSVYMRLVAGSLANVTNFQNAVSERNGAGAFLANAYGATFVPTGAALATQRRSDALTLVQATTAAITPSFVLAMTNGAAIDFTLRIGAPQLELGSAATPFIPTTTAASGAPRWDYDPATLALRGLLIEEARTNVLLNSATLGTQSVTVTAQAYTLSFTGTGTITKSGTATGALVGTGATQRVSQTFTPTAGSLTLTVTGSVTNAQLEAGQFATSFIPTTAAAVTRARDGATMPLAVAGGSAITLAADFSLEGLSTTTSQVAAQIDDGANTNRMVLFRASASQLLSAQIAGGSTLTTSVIANTTGTPMKLAASWSAASYLASAQGLAAVSGTSAAVVAMTTLRFGDNALGAGTLGGWLQRVRFWTVALSATDLRAVTS